MNHKLSCHSGTSYDEIMSFINENKGKSVLFHYELKGYPDWGNDEMKRLKLDSVGLDWISEYLGSRYEYREINSAYVHNIEVII